MLIGKSSKDEFWELMDMFRKLGLFLALTVFGAVYVFGQGITEAEIKARAVKNTAVENAKKKPDICETGTKDEKKACKELSKEKEKALKQAQEIRDAYTRAGISGCRSGEVAVDPRATRWSTFVGNGVSIRITNRSEFPIDIETVYLGYGSIIRNLCAGGSVTVSFSVVDVGNKSWSSVRVLLTAIHRFEGGKVASEDKPFYIDTSYYVSGPDRIDNQIWSVRLY